MITLLTVEILLEVLLLAVVFERDKGCWQQAIFRRLSILLAVVILGDYCCQQQRCLLEVKMTAGSKDE